MGLVTMSEDGQDIDGNDDDVKMTINDDEWNEDDKVFEPHDDDGGWYRWGWGR